VAIVYVSPGDYTPEAVALAEAELRSRGVHGEEHFEAADAVAAVQFDKRREAARISKPAFFPLLVLVFLTGDLVVVFYLLFRGRKHAARQVWAAFGYGWLARLLLISLVLLLDAC
jgi:hypothetical protein